MKESFKSERIYVYNAHREEAQFNFRIYQKFICQ